MELGSTMAPRYMFLLMKFRTQYPQIWRLGTLRISGWGNLRNGRCRRAFLISSQSRLQGPRVRGALLRPEGKEHPFHRRQICNREVWMNISNLALFQCSLPQRMFPCSTSLPALPDLSPSHSECSSSMYSFSFSKSFSTLASVPLHILFPLPGVHPSNHYSAFWSGSNLTFSKELLWPCRPDHGPQSLLLEFFILFLPSPAQFGVLCSTSHIKTSPRGPVPA